MTVKKPSIAIAYLAARSCLNRSEAIFCKHFDAALGSTSYMNLGKVVFFWVEASKSKPTINIEKLNIFPICTHSPEFLTPLSCVFTVRDDFSLKFAFMQLKLRCNCAKAFI